RLLGRPVRYFSSSHERSHLLCAFGMSSLPKGTPCYALVWEGAIGAFYEIDSELNITLLADVLNQPGNRYALLYGLADPTFAKNGLYAERFMVTTLEVLPTKLAHASISCRLFL